MSDIVDYSARAFPAWPTGRVIILTVLCKRIEGTFKAYAAIVPMNTADTDPDYENACIWVQSNGNQLLFEEAKAIFHKLKEPGVGYAT